MELEEIKQKVDAFRETVPREIKDMYFSHENVDFNGFYNMDYYFLGALDATKKSQKELEAEKKLNAEIKARFVKCNTCTDEMKTKCLMFSENLCEGERCEELVDLMSLVSKSDNETKLQTAKEIIKEYYNLKNFPSASGNSINMFMYENINKKAEAFINKELNNDKH